jgi:hypothetical protein
MGQHKVKGLALALRAQNVTISALLRRLINFWLISVVNQGV